MFLTAFLLQFILMNIFLLPWRAFPCAQIFQFPPQHQQLISREIRQVRRRIPNIEEKIGFSVVLPPNQMLAYIPSHLWDSPLQFIRLIKSNEVLAEVLYGHGAGNLWIGRVNEPVKYRKYKLEKYLVARLLQLHPDTQEFRFFLSPGPMRKFAPAQLWIERQSRVVSSDFVQYLFSLGFGDFEMLPNQDGILVICKK